MDWVIKKIDNAPTYYLYHCWTKGVDVNLSLETGFYDRSAGNKTKDNIICKGCEQIAPKEIVLQLRLLRGR